MAFVFRAEKKDIPTDKAQQPGPGHYEFPKQTEVVENRVPFHSSNERELIRPKSNEYPGPGSYNVVGDILSHEKDQHVFFIPANPGSDVIDYKATSVFKSKAKRFNTKKINENPGPGTYNLGKGFIKKGTTVKATNTKDNLNLVYDIIQKGNKIAPSIPSNVHSYGYTENEEHKLLLNKNPLMQVQQFVGPGYYESKSNTQGNKYHGPTFHKTTGKKGTNFENSSATSNLIGPGTYSVDEVNGPSYKSNPHSGFASSTTRTFDKNVKRKLGLGQFPNRTPLSSQSLGRSNVSGAETDDDEYDDEYIKEATPGPGYYHNESILSSFGSRGSRTPSSNLSLSAADKLRHFPRTMKAQAFGSSPRFKDPNPNGHDVGPGEYDVTTKLKNEGLKYIKVPFQSSNTRFERANLALNPGPGNYDPPVNIIDQVKKKANTGYAGSFGVTEGRFKISKLLEETPGPGTYIDKNKDKDSKLNPIKPSHYFVSDSKRGVFVGKIDHQAHPGSYELDYYNIAKKKDKEEDDGLDQPKRYPFNTAQARFEKPKEKPIPENDDEDDDDDEPRFGTSRNLESLLKSKIKQKPSSVFLSLQVKDQSSLSLKEPLNPQLNIFFTPKDLKIGKNMPIFFALKDPSTSPHLLPREEADSIPFSSSNLPYLLKLFSFSKDSPQAKAIEDTFFHCEISAMNGESKFCATSLESMLDGVREILGFNTKLDVYTTDFINKSPVSLQNYTILQKPKEILVPKLLACHTLPYPYAVFYCHMQKGENKLFKISLLGENGDRIEAAAICHMDTKEWNHDHVAFKVLKVQPGSSPVCHFFPADNLVWVPSSSM